MTVMPDSRRLQRRRATPVALALLLALLHLSASALVATHHHVAGAGDACQACHAAHGAALVAPAAAADGLPPAGRASQDAPRPHSTVNPILLRVRGPPASLCAA
jgi:hypothetical protein